jgi:tetratricopeptide (TPR) repeat protein
VSSTGRLALLILLLASTCCSTGVRPARNEEEAVLPQPKAAEAAKPPTIPKTPAVTEAQLAKARQDYQAGVEAFEWGRYDDAAQYLEDVYRIAPKLDEVQEYLERTYIALGMECYTAGQPEDAIAIWKKVLRIDPRDEKAKAYIARTEQEIARLPADKSR